MLEIEFFFFLNVLYIKKNMRSVWLVASFMNWRSNLHWKKKTAFHKYVTHTQGG